jgi:hypothetical protein
MTVEVANHVARLAFDAGVRRADNRCSASAVPVDDRFGQLLDRLSQSEQSNCELVALPHATWELARDYR